MNLPQIAHVRWARFRNEGDGMMKRASRLRPIGLAVAVLSGTAFGLDGPVSAQTFSSTYTSTAPRNCRVASVGTEVDDSTIRTCPGKGGLVVLISEDDLRETVSVGRSRTAADREPAAKFWFGPFSSTEHTVEWRMKNDKPFAIIQRWHIADINDEDKNGRPIAKRMLAVTRLPPGPVCHVAYIDAQANPNPNQLARKAADDFARDFKCGRDDVKIIGESGRAVSLAKR